MSASRKAQSPSSSIPQHNGKFPVFRLNRSSSGPTFILSVKICSEARRSGKALHRQGSINALPSSRACQRKISDPTVPLDNSYLVKRSFFMTSRFQANRKQLTNPATRPRISLFLSCSLLWKTEYSQYSKFHIFMEKVILLCCNSRTVLPAPNDQAMTVAAFVRISFSALRLRSSRSPYEVSPLPAATYSKAHFHAC